MTLPLFGDEDVGRSCPKCEVCGAPVPLGRGVVTGCGIICPRCFATPMFRQLQAAANPTTNEDGAQ